MATLILHRGEAQALGLLAHVGDCSELPEPVGASGREAR